MGFKFCSSSSHWILALGWEPGLEIFLLYFQQQVYYRRFPYRPGKAHQHCPEVVSASVHDQVQVRQSKSRVALTSLVWFTWSGLKRGKNGTVSVQSVWSSHMTCPKAILILSWVTVCSSHRKSDKIKYTQPRKYAN